MSEVLKVVAVSEPQPDVNGIPFRIVEMETLGIKRVTTAIGIIPAKCSKRRSKRAFWACSYLDLNPLAKELGYVDKDGNPDYKKIKEEDYKHLPCEFGFDLKVGEPVLGDIVSREVEPYNITDPETGEVLRETNLYSRIILGDTDSPAFQSTIVQEFRRQGHELIQVNESYVPELIEDKVEELLEQ